MFKKIFVSSFIIVALTVGAFGISHSVAAAQTSLWQVAQQQVGAGASSDALVSATKNLATKHDIKIPEWSWNLSGKFDVRKLSLSFLKSIASLASFGKSNVAQVVPTTPTYTYQYSFGSAGLGNGQLRYTQNLTSDSDGNIYVADAYYNRPRIQKFDQNGTFLLGWGGYGTGDTQFVDISSLTFFKGQIYVSEVNVDDIKVFDTSGNFVRKIALSVSGERQYFVAKIALDSRGNIYVLSNNTTNVVYKFTNSGTYVSSFPVENPNSANALQGITVDSNNNIYVTGYNFIREFDLNGTLVKSFNVSSLFGFYGITVDLSGYAFVGDNSYQQVDEFDPSGNYLASFKNPSGAAIYGVTRIGNGNIYAADFPSQVDVFIPSTPSTIPPIITINDPLYPTVVSTGQQMVFATAFTNASGADMGTCSFISGDGSMVPTYIAKDNNQNDVLAANYTYLKDGTFSALFECVSPLAGTISNTPTSIIASTLDTTPPTVASTSPTDLSTNVSINTTIEATFSEAIDWKTANSQNVVLLDPNGNQVEATLSSNSSIVGVLSPSVPLNYNTTYTVIIKRNFKDLVTGGVVAGLTDLAGNEISADFVWSFTTEANPVSVTIGAVLPTDTTVNTATVFTASVTNPTGVDLGSCYFYVGIKSVGNIPATYDVKAGQVSATYTYDTAGVYNTQFSCNGSLISVSGIPTDVTVTSTVPSPCSITMDKANPDFATSLGTISFGGDVLVSSNPNLLFSSDNGVKNAWNSKYDLNLNSPTVYMFDKATGATLQLTNAAYDAKTPSFTFDKPAVNVLLSKAAGTMSYKFDNGGTITFDGGALVTFAGLEASFDGGTTWVTSYKTDPYPKTFIVRDPKTLTTTDITNVLLDSKAGAFSFSIAPVCVVPPPPCSTTTTLNKANPDFATSLGTISFGGDVLVSSNPNLVMSVDNSLWEGKLDLNLVAKTNIVYLWDKQTGATLQLTNAAYDAKTPSFSFDKLPTTTVVELSKMNTTYTASNGVVLTFDPSTFSLTILNGLMSVDNTKFVTSLGKAELLKFSTLYVQGKSGVVTPVTMKADSNLGIIDFTFTTADTCGVSDTVAPVTTLTNVPAVVDGQNGWFITSPVVGTLTCADLPADKTSSGCNQTFYTLDKDSEVSGVAPIDFKMYDGIHSVSYYSNDKAGNTEVAQSASFYIDSVAPSTNVTLIDKDADKFIEAVQVDAKDETSGVAYMNYVVSLGGVDVYKSDLIKGSSIAIDLSLWTKAGKSITITYFATDNAGNTSKDQAVVANYDICPGVAGQYQGCGNKNHVISIVHNVNKIAKYDDNDEYKGDRANCGITTGKDGKKSVTAECDKNVSGVVVKAFPFTVAQNILKPINGWDENNDGQPRQTSLAALYASGAESNSCTTISGSCDMGLPVGKGVGQFTKFIDVALYTVKDPSSGKKIDLYQSKVKNFMGKDHEDNKSVRERDDNHKSYYNCDSSSKYPNFSSDDLSREKVCQQEINDMHGTNDDSTNINTIVTKTFRFLNLVSKDSNGKEKDEPSTAGIKKNSGSELDVIYPEYTIWDGTTALYPFIMTSDSDWTTDVCLQVPTGYQISAVYDQEGNIISTDQCQQTFISGETKTVLFSVSDVGSPEPDFTFSLQTKHQEVQTGGGTALQQTNQTLSVGGIRQATKDVVDTQIAQAIAPVIAQINADKQAQLAQAVQVLAPAVSPVVIAQAPTPISQVQAINFSNNLKLGKKGTDVKALQEYLNNHGFEVSKSGAGSNGMESEYFGGKTKAAVVKFQKANKLPATGFVGTMTRSLLNR